MVSTEFQFPDSSEVGALGVCHLKRFWARTIAARATGRSPAAEIYLDRVVLDGIGLGLEQTMHHLAREATTFEDFERWIITVLGTIDPERQARVNAFVRGEAYPQAVEQWLRSIDDMEPVLSGEDLAHWEEHGFVVLHNAVAADDLRAARSAVWNYLQMDPSDPDSWYGSRSHGIMVQLFQHPALVANRRSPRIHKAFSQLWGTTDLWVTTDRVSFNPPERPGFPFPGPHLHWDVSLEPPIPLGIQGLLYLTDTPAEQGAFTAVPGFHTRILAWLDALPVGADPRKQKLHELGAIPIGGRAGDMIIWHHALPHGASPNRGTDPRIVQYVKLYPAIRETRRWR